MAQKINTSWERIEASVVLRQNDLFQQLQDAIGRLSLVADNWNGYRSPRPTLAAIRGATAIIQRFQALDFKPEKVMASADGGVSLVFVGHEKRRAVIESFGTEDDYVLFYDIDGSSETFLWPKGEVAQNDLLNELQAYLRGL